MNHSLRKFLAALALVAVLPVSAQGQPYPNRPIKMVLPFPAGSATDGAARVIAEEVRKSLGQPIVIDNQAGADGIIAAQAVKRAAPDGYTLLVSTNSAHGSNPSLHQQLPYDPQKDFEPVAGLIRIPLALCVRKDFPADDLQGFIKVAEQRAATKSLSYGTGNTSNRVATELLKSLAKPHVKEAIGKMAMTPMVMTPVELQTFVGSEIRRWGKLVELAGIPKK